MPFKIHFSTSTLKTLYQFWLKAYQAGEQQLLRRLEALQLLAQGYAPAQIGQWLEVATSTVYAWLKAYLQKGSASFHFQRPAGRKPKLDQAQCERLKSLIVNGPLHCGFSSGLWSGAVVAELIEREFAVKLHPRYVPSLLKKLGFSYQKARFESSHLDEERRQEWLNQTWPQVVAEAQRQKALVLFGDEASFAQWGSLSYTWAVRGQQPIVPTTGIRKAYKVFGMLDYFTGQLWWSGHTERFNAQSYCNFLAQVLAQTAPDQKIIVVQDGARYHTARATKEWLTEHSQRITLYQLPAYSPDYNPIEHLWRRVKRQATHNRYFAEFNDLIASVKAALDNLAAKPDEVKALSGTVLDKVLTALPQA